MRAQHRRDRAAFSAVRQRADADRAGGLPRQRLQLGREDVAGDRLQRADAARVLRRNGGHRREDARVQLACRS